MTPRNGTPVTAAVVSDRGGTLEDQRVKTDNGREGGSLMTRLRTERTARGWSQAQLIHALSRVAAAEGLKLPAHESMRIMLSRWENGHAQPDETYRRYLCAVFHTDEGSLGLGCLNRLTISGVAMPLPEVSAALIAHLGRTFDELAKTDNQYDLGD